MSTQTTEVATPSKEEQTFKEMYAKFIQPFPQEAYTCDSSRGFNLTSIKPQYIVERLNVVLGVNNWVFRSKEERIGEGVLCSGELLISNGAKQVGRESAGFALVKKLRWGDAYKSAKTDALSKAASHFGIGNDVFKGLVAPPTPGSGTGRSSTAKLEDF